MTIPRELGLKNYKNELVLTQTPLCEVSYQLKVEVPTSGIVGLQGFVKVGFNADKGVVFVNEFEAEYTPTTEEIHLKIVVDSSSVELFTGDGVRSISVAVFPDPGTSRELEPFQE